MNIQVSRKSAVFSSYRSERVRGLFNVTEEDGSQFELDADLPIENDAWQVGIVVGSSGSGKSSIGDELVANTDFKLWNGGRWSKEKPIIDAMPDASFDQWTALLSTVGLGSVPSWLRPYGVLSNGERFRADCAALLMRGPQNAIVDEFTSVLDRQVACVGAGAFIKAWRKQESRRIVLLTCHEDVIPWMEPDWVFSTDDKQLYLGDHIRESVDPSQYPEVGRLVVQR